MKYYVVWFLSNIIINQLWMMWEEIKYGEVMIDRFDGLVLIFFCTSLMLNWYLVDKLREGKK